MTGQRRFPVEQASIGLTAQTVFLQTSNPLAYFGDELRGNIHHCCMRGIESCLILGDGLFFCLRFVVLDHASDTLFVPAERKLRFPGHDGFPRLRHLYASSGLPRRSYAVITNTLLGSGSGT